MASEQAVLNAWTVLKGAGIACPWKTEGDLGNALQTWMRVLEDLTDKQLSGAVDAHCRTSQWWPRPAQLIALAPRAAPDRQDSPRDWPGLIWSELPQGEHRDQLLKQAEAEVYAAPCKQGGQWKRCVCDDCLERIWRRADELATDSLSEQPTEAA